MSHIWQFCLYSNDVVSTRKFILEIWQSLVKVDKSPNYQIFQYKIIIIWYFAGHGNSSYVLLLTIITEANQNTDCTLYLLHCGCSALEYSLQRLWKTTVYI